MQSQSLFHVRHNNFEASITTRSLKCDNPATVQALLAGMASPSSTWAPPSARHIGIGIAQARRSFLGRLPASQAQPPML